MKKTLLMVLALLSMAVLAGYGYLSFILPDVGPAEDLKFDHTEDRVARGRYLANSVAVCMDCHSTRDWSRFSGPLVPGTLGSGGEAFTQELGFPGRFYAKNITPHGIGDWTDGELLRAIAAGVGRDGKAFFPVMPYLSYGSLDKEDLLDIIAYLRTLAPVASVVPPSEPDFPMNLILNTIPSKPAFTVRPGKTDQVAYGKYMLTMAACAECHTKQEKGSPVPGMDLAGGFEFKLPMGSVLRSSNITPDKETGIGHWSEDAFVSRFKMYAEASYTPPAVNGSEFQTIMPWTMYATMEEDDLRAIYAYLRTVPPVNHRVKVFTP